MELLPDEEWLGGVVNGLVVVVEAAGALVIFAGVLIAVVMFFRALPQRDADAFVPVRLTLGRFIALGLEFQLASDVMRTAVAPSFEELGKLAVVAALRTALNYFLSREIAEERRILKQKEGTSDPAATEGQAQGQR